MKKIRRIGLYSLIGIVIFSTGVGMYLGIRRLQARQVIEQELNTALLDAPVLRSTAGLEILPLYEEARVSRDLESGHGVSYLLRTDHETILLDLGNNPDQIQPSPLMHNMEALGISLNAIDALVISHPHPDHLGGVASWREGAISLGFSPGENPTIAIFSPVQLNNPDLIVSRNPVLISPGVATTGAIPYPEVFPLNLSNPIGREQALVIHVRDQGLVLITGCGHPGLEELIQRSETLYGHPVIGVVGGLHYGEAGASELADPIAYLQGKSPELVALSPHDSEAAALNAFQDAFPETFQVLEVGRSIHFP